MPIAIDPDQTYEYVLDSDRSKPENERPTFVLRHQTVRQWRQTAEAAKRADNAPNAVEAIEAVLSAIRGAMAGWRNIVDADGNPRPYSVNELDDVLTVPEASELFRAIMAGAAPRVDDLKK